MDDTKLIAQKRETKGSAAARRLRREGILPAVVYSEGKEATSIQLDAHTFEQMLNHHATEHMMVELTIDGAAVPAVVKDVEHHPVTGTVMHADFQAVSMDKEIHVAVPVELVGEAEGVKAGGVLEHLLHEVEVQCLPGDLMEAIELDVSDMKIGDLLTLADIGIDADKYTFLADADTAVATVAGPRTEADDAEGAEQTEPEVIGASAE